MRIYHDDPNATVASVCYRVSQTRTDFRDLDTHYD